MFSLINASLFSRIPIDIRRRHFLQTVNNGFFTFAIPLKEGGCFLFFHFCDPSRRLVRSLNLFC